MKLRGPVSASNPRRFVDLDHTLIHMMPEEGREGRPCPMLAPYSPAGSPEHAANPEQIFAIAEVRARARARRERERERDSPPFLSDDLTTMTTRTPPPPPLPVSRDTTATTRPPPSFVSRRLASFPRAADRARPRARAQAVLHGVQDPRTGGRRHAVRPRARPRCSTRSTPRARASSSSRATSSGARCAARSAARSSGTGRATACARLGARRRCRARSGASTCGRGSRSLAAIRRLAPRGRQGAAKTRRDRLPGAPLAAHDRVAHAAAALAARDAAHGRRARHDATADAAAAARPPRVAILDDNPTLWAREDARALPGGGATRDARSISRRGSSARARARSLSLGTTRCRGTHADAIGGKDKKLLKNMRREGEEEIEARASTSSTTSPAPARERDWRAAGDLQPILARRSRWGLGLARACGHLGRSSRRCVQEADEAAA